MTSAPNVLVLDHRDSFVFTLVDQLQRLGARVRTLRSDVGLDALQEDLARLDPDLVVLSPGPGHPADAGVFPAFLRTRPRVPVLGVCLGHQALAHVEGGRVEARTPVHGRSCVVRHRGGPLFEHVPETFTAGRYHSLAVAEVPDAFEVLATTGEDGDEVVMAIRHRALPQVGLQFHPESVLTPAGNRLVANILRHAISQHRNPNHDPAAHPAAPRR